MKQGFIPDSATITRREDGAWDMVALFRLEDRTVEMAMILADATFSLEVFYRQGQPTCPCDLCCYVPCELTGYELTLHTALRPGVQGHEGIYLRQRTVSGGCNAAE